MNDAVGSAEFRVIGRSLIARALEGRRHVPDGKAQVTHRAVPDETRPVRRRLMRRIDLARHRCFDRSRTADSLGPGDAHCRADHALGDHRHGHRRPAHDVDCWALRWSFVTELQDVAPDVALNELCDALGWDADQHDGFVMRHESRAGDLALGRQAHEDLDGLPGVAGRIDPVRVDEGISNHFLSGERLDQRRIAFNRAIVVRTGNQF